MPAKKSLKEKYVPILLIFALLCGVCSMIAVILSYFHSGDERQLFKLSLPVIIIIIIVASYRRNKKAGTPQ